LAYAQDLKAIGLAVEGLERGFYDTLATVWEKTFHAAARSFERLADSIAALRWPTRDPVATAQVCAYEFLRTQARGHRAVLARFGRQPDVTSPWAGPRPPRSWTIWRPHVRAPALLRRLVHCPVWRPRKFHGRVGIPSPVVVSSEGGSHSSTRARTGDKCMKVMVIVKATKASEAGEMPISSCSPTWEV
jgi:hypothetical protein